MIASFTALATLRLISRSSNAFNCGVSFSDGKINSAIVLSSSCRYAADVGALGASCDVANSSAGVNAAVVGPPATLIELRMSSINWSWSRAKCSLGSASSS